MANPAGESGSSSSGWRPMQAYLMAVVCLLIGLPVGYLLRGSAAPKATLAVAAPEKPQPAAATPAPKPPAQMPSLEQMKQMADRKAAPLVEKLKSDPKNFELLVEVGDIYRATHQFPEAAAYYDKALEVNPKNVTVRTVMASCLYYSGDVDGALAQLNKSLTYDPKHAGTLMNIGIIKWQSKKDVKGAVAAWQKLLKLNPDFPQKQEVQHLIIEAQQPANAAQSPNSPKG